MVLSYLKVAKPKSKDNILILPASKHPDIVKIIKMINGDTYRSKIKKMEKTRS